MYSDDYWSIDAILAGETAVKAIFKSDILGYGFLGEERDPDLKKQQKTYLPLWLAKELHMIELVELYSPPYFSKPFWATLKADATVVNLRNKSDYFYETLFILKPVFRDEQLSQILPIILKTFVERLKMILSNSEILPTNFETTKLKQRLCFIEVKLFESSRTRFEEVRNFKQQIGVLKNYWVEDPMFKKQSKRVRTM